ncbi:ATP-grasp domain-containing protein [Rubinisphaera margarita]|uniref:ATP-grasp domain-containing protein n=1 Tax=Rubinisphaera margarita TaxID=2909586 RepID=UPI001EE7A68A|nr:ATP-grasp domain-containing protein [Rubinisphaera margarita]MCG6157005.1 ATP-grasp domain-containing protein [Rubinisphaera margarita]
MKSIFVSEFLCSGALSEQDLPESLTSEGQAMLAAVCEDLLRTGRYHVCTTLDERAWPDCPQAIEFVRVKSSSEEWGCFQKLAQRSTATLVIAPELGQELERRVTWLEAVQRNSTMSFSPTVSLTSDKLRFGQWCEERGIATLPVSIVADDGLSAIDWAQPHMIKPRYGAGATATVRVESQAAAKRFLENEQHREFGPFIIQPWLDAMPLSIAGVVCPQTGRRQWGPLGRQKFADGHYSGGTIPFPCPATADAFGIIEQVCDQLPGLRGWIGFDFLYSTSASPPLQLLEVNPRMTTSYLGYRQLTETPLAELMLGFGQSKEVRWRPGTVDFSAVP